MRISHLLACLIAFAAATNGRATTIVVARSANEIVIGADSKVTDTIGNDLNKRACKIKQVGNLFLAFEGFEIDRRTGYNVQDISASALRLRPNATAADRVSSLTGFLVTRLLNELLLIRSQDPDGYARKFAGGQVFLGVAIAGFENNRPLVFVRSFRAVELSAKQIGVTVLADDCLDNCQGAVVTRFFGETEAIDGLADENPNFWKAGLVEGVRKLVETEIEARSEYVGPPIDILRIDRNGAQWIQKKPECAPILNQNKRPRR